MTETPEIVATITLDKADRKEYRTEARGGRIRSYRNYGSDDPHTSSRVYVNFTGDKAGVLENLVNRTNRPWQTVKPAVVKALQDAGYDATGLRWSQKAGCSMCPCSPGFLMPKVHGHDIWMDLNENVQAAVPISDDGIARLASVATDSTLPASMTEPAMASLKELLP